MKELGDRHIKTPLNCEIEHSVKIDLTFTAYRSLSRAVPKFLDNCFIIGFTYFPVATLTSSEEGVIFKSPWQLKEASLLLRERLALECSCQLLHKQKSVLWKWGMILCVCVCWLLGWQTDTQGCRGEHCQVLRECGGEQAASVQL